MFRRPYRVGPACITAATGGVAEAAFFLGVNAQRAGRFEEALTWMERALSLNPGHERTRSQVEALRQALGRE